MAALQPAAYEELKAFLRFFSERFFDLSGLAPNLRPVALLEATERTNPTRASSALRMAINDCVEMSSHWPPAQVSSLDAELQTRGLLSLSKVRQRYWGRYAAVLKRGRIRNAVEYYMVQGVLADQSLFLDSAERQCLEGLASAYERAAP